MSLATILKVAVAFCAVANVHGGFLSKRQCSGGLQPSYPAPNVASGWTAQLVANGITRARGLTIDSSGALLVAQSYSGVTRLTFTESGNCLSLASKTTVVSKNDLTHGIALSANGTTLYASSAEAVFAWPYNPTTGTSTGAISTIINNMNNADHISRTLTMSKKQPSQLIVSRGSNENVDAGTKDITSGRSQIRVFDLNALPSGRAYNYATEGRVLGWGLRNDVGVAEHPVTGGIWSVENSVDQLTRNGVDIHTDNPGEELNYLGALSDPVPSKPPNYGYPDSHMAPLDLVFNANGTEAMVTFHGSWNRQPPIGYKFGTIKFANGEPTEPSTSTTALTDILTMKSLTSCPSQCFQPVGLAVDSKGRVFMSSDTTGEIYVLQKTA
ncbi:hypothetical protein J7T55_007699 [Diaporthe amygdali]|uniref:uncharacterized protein n=1 Tax=Phomopsis amygdali TaxID=1214568 RepID=UPI0022FEDE79|nr:uncharacterized protein J7T55_007699 [Diaporthe amygdali]KAJ0107510.1 hypothetical protein J7T55_007699 [Diaporthe amygdali]